MGSRPPGGRAIPRIRGSMCGLLDARAGDQLAPYAGGEWPPAVAGVLDAVEERQLGAGVADAINPDR